MVRRSHFLLATIAASTCLTTGYWLWPDQGRPLTATVAARFSGPLYVVRVEPVTDAAVAALVESLSPHLPVPVRATDDWVLDERGSLRWEEDLYDSRVLIARLNEITAADTRVLGITDQPMFEEGHWWLYGTAQLGGRAAVVSTAHLWVDYIAGNTEHPIFRQRLSKVAVHEIGHTLGFSHCTNQRCVM